MTDQQEIQRLEALLKVYRSVAYYTLELVSGVIDRGERLNNGGIPQPFIRHYTPMADEILPLKKARKVIAADLKAQGRSR